MEPPRPKVHWDYLCEEMQWLSADFAQERRWKRGVARKVPKMLFTKELVESDLMYSYNIIPNVCCNVPLLGGEDGDATP